jgi:thioredoxin-like negative regulator of GroEL
VTDDKTSTKPNKPKGISPSMIVLLVVVAILSGVVFAKTQGGTATPPSTTAAGAASGVSAQATGGTITSVHNDAAADYEAALKTGKPVYVLFHSLTCQPCVEISAVVDKVMPAYEGKVVFVNAITEDQPSQQLAAKFQFQYIPTSFFVKPDGSIADSFTGAMSDAEMRARLDKLIAP